MIITSKQHYLVVIHDTTYACVGIGMWYRMLSFRVLLRLLPRPFSPFASNVILDMQIDITIIIYEDFM